MFADALVEATVVAEYLNEESCVTQGKLPSPFGQVPRCLCLHPDPLPPHRGMPVRHPHDTQLLPHTDFNTCSHEAPPQFQAKVFDSLTLHDLSFWFPDQSRTASQHGLGSTGDLVRSRPSLLHGPQILMQQRKCRCQGRTAYPYPKKPWRGGHKSVNPAAGSSGQDLAAPRSPSPGADPPQRASAVGCSIHTLLGRLHSTPRQDARSLLGPAAGLKDLTGCGPPTLGQGLSREGMPLTDLRWGAQPVTLVSSQAAGSTAASLPRQTLWTHCQSRQWPAHGGGSCHRD